MFFYSFLDMIFLSISQWNKNRHGDTLTMQRSHKKTVAPFCHTVLIHRTTLARKDLKQKANADYKGVDICLCLVCVSCCVWMNVRVRLECVARSMRCKCGCVCLKWSHLNARILEYLENITCSLRFLLLGAGHKSGERKKGCLNAPY